MHVDVKGSRLWFDVDGPALVPDGSQMRERPTVVLLHGGPGSFDHSYFKPDFARLTETAQVIYLDLPGHGRSTWGDPSAWRFASCADDLRGFCDALGIVSPAVYGHSLGGFVAMLYAARHPDHPGALVLQSTMARFDLGRIVEGFRRDGGDEVAAIAQRFYGGARQSVTAEEWARCWRLAGPWVVGPEGTGAHRPQPGAEHAGARDDARLRRPRSARAHPLSDVGVRGRAGSSWRVSSKSTLLQTPRRTWRKVSLTAEESGTSLARSRGSVRTMAPMPEVRPSVRDSANPQIVAGVLRWPILEEWEPENSGAIRRGRIGTPLSRVPWTSLDGRRDMEHRRFITSCACYAVVLVMLTAPQIARGQWPADPSLNTPVCTVTNGQYFPVVCGDGANGAIVAWSDTRDAGPGIYAQRFDLDGMPMWAADGVLVTPGAYGGNYGELVVVSDGAAGAIFAWTTGDIYAQRLDASGVKMWGPVGVALCTAAGYQGTSGGTLGIVSDAAGGAIVTWNDLRDSPTLRAYARRVSAGGTPLWTSDGVNLGIGTPSGGTAPDGIGGAIVAGVGPSPGFDLVAQRVSAAGTLLWGSSGVVVTPGAGGTLDAVVADGAGGAIFAYLRGAYPNHDVYAQRVNSSGTVQWAPASTGVALCTATFIQEFPRLCTDGDGGAIVAWADARSVPGGSGEHIYARRVSAAGGAMWAADGVPVAAGPASLQSAIDYDIVADGQQGAIIAWSDNRGSNPDIFAQRLNALGQSQWAANGELVCTAANQQEHPRLVPAGSCCAIVAWQDYRGGIPYTTDYDIYAQQIGCDGDLAEVCALVDVPIRPRQSGVWLGQPRPSPARHQITVSFTVPMATRVLLEIIDVSGRLVRTLTHGTAAVGPGEFDESWDLRNAEGVPVRAGIYFIQLRAEDFGMVTRRVIVLR